MNTPLADLASNRRQFLQVAAAGVAGLGVGLQPAAAAGASGRGPGRSGMRLGLVTYNLAKDWDVPTVIRNCAEARFEGVELRTTHAHGVEVTLSAAQRAEVRRRFADSPVELFGLGSAFDYHTPDAAKLRRDIEATKDYLVLAHDVGASGVKVRPNGLAQSGAGRADAGADRAGFARTGEFAAGHGQQIRLEVHGAGTSSLPHIRTIMDVADHPSVGVCWNSNQTDLEGDGLDANFDRVKARIVAVHMRDLFLEEYPWRRLLARLNGIGFRGFCLAEIPESRDPLRVMQYYRALWLAYQDVI